MRTLSILVVGASLVAAGCAGKTAGEARGGAGTGDAAALPGAGGVPSRDAATGAGGTGGAETNPDATSEDGRVGSGGQPSPADDPCFEIPPGACGNFHLPLATLPTDATVSQASVLGGGDGFVLTLSRPMSPGPGSWIQVASVGREGGCGVPISEVRPSTSITWGPTDVGAGGDTVAAVMRCGGKFACGAELHRNGVLHADLWALFSEDDIYAAVEHRIAVAQDGVIFLASGPRRGVATAVSRRLVAWLPQKASAVTIHPVDGPEYLVDVDTIDDRGLQAGVVALLTETDAGGVLGSLEVHARDGGLMARSELPGGVEVIGVASAGSVIVALGRVLTDAGPRTWLSAYEAPTLMQLWLVTVPDLVGTPTAVDVTPGGRVRALVVDEAARRLDFVETMGIDVSVTSYPIPAGMRDSLPADLGFAPDGALLLTLGNVVSHCPAPL